ncbi:hypothetical protein A2V82_16430 [candidate division KSB1 bacterium RBG_16_48_16]|nr:MAG: hypothetical protein A2V82_16430 [candidate division KSB1 bacterium RBG_16_48_16]
MKDECGGCLYFWFKGLVKWCLHPKHNSPLPPLNLRGGANGGGVKNCPEFIEWDIKVAPGQEAAWPEPIRMRAEG